MTRFLIRAAWMLFVACCCTFNDVQLLARPVSGEPGMDDAAVASSRSVETATGPRTGSSFPLPATTEMPFRGDAELFSSASRAIGSAVLLVGVILIGSFLLKRYWPEKFGSVSGGRHIEVIETAALGERQSLTLVQVGRSRLLLARTAGGITLIDRTVVTAEPAADSVPALPKGAQDTNGAVSIGARNGVQGKLRQIGARFEVGLVKAMKTLRTFPQMPQAYPRVKSPSFEQVMQAELQAGPSPNTRTGSDARSRLSEIRSRLQSE